MRKFFLMTGIAVPGIVLLFGQSGLRSASGTVTVPAIVTAEAKQGQQVPSLKQGDVAAYNGKDRLEVQQVVPLQDSAIDLMVLLDDSSDTNLGAQFSDLRHFIQAQPAATQIGIAYMRNGTFELAQGFTGDHSKASSALRLPFSSSGAMTSPYLSLSDLIRRWPGKAARREVVMVTSGIDPLGGLGPIDPYLNDALEDAQRGRVIVYTIYTPASGHSGHSVFRIYWGQNHLAQLAEETGGEYYMLGYGAPVAFAPYLDDIAEHLKHQYLVTLFIKPGKKAGFEGVRFI